jgi:tetratricopeptide (TPR) repeat protein
LVVAGGVNWAMTKKQVGKLEKTYASADEALEAFNDAAEPFGEGDYAAALAIYDQVLRFHTAHRKECEESNLSRGEVIANMAICQQRLENFSVMYELTSELLKLKNEDAPGLHAVAAHHIGKLDEALKFIDQAIAAMPEDGDHHWERSGILLARGERDAAIDSVITAADLGAALDEMLNDKDLAELKSDPRVHARVVAKPKLPLFDRLDAWLKIFAQRNDIKTKIKIVREPGSPADYPADAAPFAAKAKCVSLEYFCLEPRFKNDSKVLGQLFLTLEGHPLEINYDLEGASEPMLLEEDENGTGLVAFSARDDDGDRRIFWDIETMAKFSSLEEYLTQGAHYAFQYGGAEPLGCWQEKPAAKELWPLSISRLTPNDELKKALMKRGASDEMAADLITWLGKDVALLLPAKG